MNRRILLSISNNKLIQAIKKGLLSIIPVLMVGSFALILRSLPITVYQNFINSFFDGVIYDCLSMVYNATFGLLSIYMTIAIGSSYASTFTGQSTKYGMSLVALVSFSIFTGVLSDSFNINAFGVKGMFTAIVTALFSSVLYAAITKRLKLSVRLYADGADTGFNNAITMIVPLMIIATVFTIINYGIITLFGVSSLHELFISIANQIFAGMGRSFLSGFLFVLLSSVLWFFGIHGSDIFESVVDNLFTPAIELNAMAVEMGRAPQEILTKTFFDVFVLMGGCGSALCLLVSLILFSKRKSNRSLAEMAAFPMIFNINELMVFGLPIVFNPVMLVPFILTPLACYFVTYGAMALEIVPLTVNAVEWTTPIFLGGYLSTGSVWGIVLQFVNLVIGTLIYMPFVRLYDRQKIVQAKQGLSDLIDVLKKSEIDHEPIVLTHMDDTIGGIAKALVLDLKSMIEKKNIILYYQPQFDSNNKCIGVEALLRWFHTDFGLLYPPLVIKLAEEAGLLPQLERMIIEKAIADSKDIGLPDNIKMSINVTVTSLQNTNFVKYLKELSDEKKNSGVCLEITEQKAVVSGESMEKLLEYIKNMNFSVAIDDFSMGYTSLKYLQENKFDLVKIDGSLVRGMRDNQRCKDIIASIVYLSQSLGFNVLAEFVETDEQRDALKEIGCNMYQGYLYSCAIAPDDLKRFLSELKS